MVTSGFWNPETELSYTLPDSKEPTCAAPMVMSRRWNTMNSSRMTPPQRIVRDAYDAWITSVCAYGIGRARLDCTVVEYAAQMWTLTATSSTPRRPHSNQWYGITGSPTV